MTSKELEKLNLNIDLREINYELKNRKNIMASEYKELHNKKVAILKAMGFLKTK